MTKKILQSCSLILLWSLCVNVAFAQMSTLKGKITDSKSGEPLIGVTVTYKEGVKVVSGASTDADGNYVLPVGTSGTVYYSYIGYKLASMPVSKATGGALDLKMDEDVANLDEVVVTGLATSVKRSNLANDVTTLSAKQITGVT